MSYKPLLCLDFDGVLHSYTSGWKGADVVSDPPVPGAMLFILNAFASGWRVAIFSSRSNQPGGLDAMKDWLLHHMVPGSRSLLDDIEWPLEKPPATLTLDDRAITFTGVFPDPEQLLSFKPWNKQ